MTSKKEINKQELRRSNAAGPHSPLPNRDRTRSDRNRNAIKQELEEMEDESWLKWLERMSEENLYENEDYRND